MDQLIAPPPLQDHPKALPSAGEPDPSRRGGCLGRQVDLWPARDVVVQLQVTLEGA